jgi:hypothetical protein
VTEFETHLQAQLVELQHDLAAALIADEPDQVASLTFQIEDLLRLSRDQAS